MSWAVTFLDALAKPVLAELESARSRLVEWVERAWTEARAAWPGVEVSPEAFGARIAAAVSSKPRPAEYEGLHVADLYLACACCAGDAAAVDEIDRVHLPAVGRALARMGIEESLRPEVLSKVREQLFVPQPSGAPPLLAAYAGRGTLRSWLQSIGIHAALKARRGRKRALPLEDLASRLPVAGADPELDYLSRFYVSEFRAGLERAMATLARRERNLLRQHYLDGMSLDAVARAYRVHRATAARWIAAARETVLGRTKEELAAALHLDPSELASVLAFVQARSSLDVNVSSLLRRPS